MPLFEYIYALKRIVEGATINFFYKNNFFVEETVTDIIERKIDPLIEYMSFIIC